MSPENALIKFPHYPENVPEELKIGERWVNCDEYKVPQIAIVSGACFAAKSTNPDPWRSYETALQTWLENEHVTGIGRVIAANEDFVGVDLDKVISEDGEVSPWALRILDSLDSYAEISPSLRGIKIWVRAPEIKAAYKKPGLEIYPQRRYFTVTGIRHGNTTEIRSASQELVALIEEEFPKVSRDSTPYNGPARTLDLDQLLESAEVAWFEFRQDSTALRKYSIPCPWAEEHTNGDTTGTYCGQYPDGALFFHCWHSHCSHRRWPDFRHYVETVASLGRPPRNGGGRLR
jgi:hypothetical protein